MTIPAFHPALVPCLSLLARDQKTSGPGEDFASRQTEAAPAPVAPVDVAPRLLAVAALLVAGLFWGAGNVANKTVLDHIGPLTALAVRCGLAALLILPLVLREGRLPTVGGWFTSSLRLSVLFMGAVLFQQMAFQWTSVTNASFLVNTCTVMTPVLAWVFLRERSGPTIALAAAITLMGAFLMSGAALGSSGGASSLGDTLCLLSALCYAAWMVALGVHARAHGRPLATMLVQFASTAVVVLPAALLVEQPGAIGLWAARGEVLFLAVFSTAGAFVLTAWAQRHVSAAVAVVLVSSESLFGALGAFLVMGERLAPAGLLGAGLILLAILLVAVSPAPERNAVPRMFRRRLDVSFRQGASLTPPEPVALPFDLAALAAEPMVAPPRTPAARPTAEPVN